MGLAELTRFTELRLAVRAAPGEVLRIAFRKVPGLAEAELGGVAVDWGDGFVERPALALSRAELEAAVRGAPPPYAALEHRAAAGRGLVTVRAPAGRLPALQLPWQTEAVLSPLPQIVDGTVDAELRLAPARTLPALFASDATSPYLTELPADLLVANPQLERFDATFAGCALRTLPAGLFAPCERIASLERTFAACALCSLPDGLLAAADART
ncbi:MAG: hypothetical protein HUK26_05610, partial [Duodenibacillus sp.]|nr:hypothetical protein [Duodenibacillus sp.]